jgi:gamma-glutamyl phosphate reductase
MLRRYRVEDTSILVWVDQLCIDQSSMADKQSQIGLMKTIYEKATRVEILAGRLTLNSSSAFVISGCALALPSINYVAFSHFSYDLNRVARG